MILGVGIDLAEINRIKKAILRHKDYFIRRVYTPSEKDYCFSKKDPYPSLAVRFAAKEAVFKALGRGWPTIFFKDVEIRRDHAGKPSVSLSGTAAALAASKGRYRIHLSLSHEAGYAAAVAVMEAY